MFMGQWVLIITFLLSHWEKYITGTLFLPWTFDTSQIVSNLYVYLFTVSLIYRVLINLHFYMYWLGTEAEVDEMQFDFTTRSLGVKCFNL